MKVAAYRLEDTAAGFQARLEATHASDKAAEKLIRKAKITAIVGFVCTIPSCIVGAAIGWELLLAKLSLAIGVGALAFWFWKRRYDVEDRKLLAATRILKVLRADVPVAARLGVNVDFRGYRRGGEVVKKAGGFFASVKSKRYRHQWLQLQAPLLDGSRVQIGLTDLVNRKTKSKRKYTKVRETWTGQVEIGLRLAKHYGAAEALAGRLERLDPPPGLSRVAVRARGRVVSVVLGMTTRGYRIEGRRSNSDNSERGRCGAEVALSTLAWVYRGIALGRSAA